jgi:hypothetical protein
MTYTDYLTAKRILARAEAGVPGVREIHQDEVPAVQRGLVVLVALIEAEVLSLKREDALAILAKLGQEYDAADCGCEDEAP